MRKIHLERKSDPFPQIIDRMAFLLKERDPLSCEVHVKNALDVIYDELGLEEEDHFYFAHSLEETFYSVLLAIHLKKKAGHCVIALSHLPFLSRFIERLEALEWSVSLLEPDHRGVFTKEALMQAVRSETTCVFLSGGDCTTGVLQETEVFGNYCKSRGIHLHVEVSSLLSTIPFCFREMHIDSFSFAGKDIHGPLETAGLAVKEKALVGPLFDYAHIDRVVSLDALSRTLVENEKLFDHFHLEIARLKYRFEKLLEDKIPGVTLLFQNEKRLPNYLTASFEGIFPEMLLYYLERRGIYSTFVKKEGALSFCLPATFSEEDLEHVMQILQEGVTYLNRLSGTLPKEALWNFPFSWGHFSKKFHHRAEKPLYTGTLAGASAELKEMRLVLGKASNEQGSVCFYLLVDESDGVVADVKFEMFGSPLLLGMADYYAELLMRKNYEHIKRLSLQDLLKKMGSKEECAFSLVFPLLHQAVLDAANQCLDIPFLELALPEEALEGESHYPDWRQLSQEAKIAIVEEVIAVEIAPYIALDAGGVRVLDLINGKEVLIAYEGSCTSCYSATGSTLDAIQRTLRAKIDPEIIVTPDLSLLSN